MGEWTMWDAPSDRDYYQQFCPFAREEMTEEPEDNGYIKSGSQPVQASESGR